MFLVAVGYLVVMPLYRLQAEAFRNGAEGYRLAYTAPGIGRVIGYTVFLALGSLAIALVLGTLLAWAASRLPRRLGFMRILPILPIVVPAVANVVGWAFLFSPRPGYLNHYLRMLPWWRHLTEGPVDIYTMPWIVILTGFGLTSFVYLFVSAGFANISAEHLEAAEVAGSSTWGVFFKVILPLLRPTLIYGGGVALLLGLGQFTAPLLLGRNGGIDVITTNMYSAMTAYPTQYGTAAALGSPLLLLGIVIVVGQKFLLGNQRRFVTHTGRAFRHQAKGSKLAALGDPAVQHDGHDPADRCAGDRLADPLLVGARSCRASSPWRTTAPCSTRTRSPTRSRTACSARSSPCSSRCPWASSPPTSCCG